MKTVLVVSVTAALVGWALGVVHLELLLARRRPRPQVRPRLAAALVRAGTLAGAASGGWLATTNGTPGTLAPFLESVAGVTCATVLLADLGLLRDGGVWCSIYDGWPPRADKLP